MSIDTLFDPALLARCDRPGPRYTSYPSALQFTSAFTEADFRRRYGELFQGPRALGYEEALDLMREMERLRQLEESLLSGDLERVSLEDLRALLGDEAANDLQLLRQMMMLITRAGYVSTREGQTRLSPKGVRKIGQPVLSDRLGRGAGFLGALCAVLVVAFVVGEHQVLCQRGQDVRPCRRRRVAHQHERLLDGRAAANRVARRAAVTAQLLAQQRAALARLW